MFYGTDHTAVSSLLSSHRICSYKSGGEFVCLELTRISHTDFVLALQAWPVSVLSSAPALGTVCTVLCSFRMRPGQGSGLVLKGSVPRPSQRYPVIRTRRTQFRRFTANSLSQPSLGYSRSPTVSRAALMQNKPVRYIKPVINPRRCYFTTQPTNSILGGYASRSKTYKKKALIGRRS